MTEKKVTVIARIPNNEVGRETKQSVRSRKAGSRSRPSSLCDDETDKDWVTVGIPWFVRLNNVETRSRSDKVETDGLLH
ncbi:MAG: hypothetical protein ABSD46_03355 [Bacteroidota bacterium]